MSTTIVANRLFCIYTFGIVIVWITVIATATRNVVSSQETLADEGANTRACKGLCEQCNCMAFYCGEECICECNDEQSDTECIARMQSSARKQRMPFEILIQGPTANSFVRNALQFEQNSKRCSKNTCHRKRSTVTIYKPQKDLKSKASWEPKKTIVERSKRSTHQQFEWFQDFSNTLVRPAPLGRRPKTSYESITSTTHNPQKFNTKQMLDNSWFNDYTPKVLTPKPLFNRRQSAHYNRYENENNEDSTTTATRSTFPHEHALRAFGQDIANALGVSSPKDSNENNNNSGDFENKSFRTDIFKKHKVSKYVDTNDDVDNEFQMSNEESQEDKTPPQKRHKKPSSVGRRQYYKTNSVPEFRIPWFRPVNLFKTFQYGFNT